MLLIWSYWWFGYGGGGGDSDNDDGADVDGDYADEGDLMMVIMTMKVSCVTRRCGIDDAGWKWKWNQ